jgi:hypothetical protein
VRAARFEDLKVPNPIKVAVSPLDTAVTMAAMTASSALAAAALDRFASLVLAVPEFRRNLAAASWERSEASRV